MCSVWSSSGFCNWAITYFHWARPRLNMALSTRSLFRVNLSKFVTLHPYKTFSQLETASFCEPGPRVHEAEDAACVASCVQPRCFFFPLLFVGNDFIATRPFVTPHRILRTLRILFSSSQLYMLFFFFPSRAPSQGLHTL